MLLLRPRRRPDLLLRNDLDLLLERKLEASEEELPDELLDAEEADEEIDRDFGFGADLELLTAGAVGLLSMGASDIGALFPSFKSFIGNFFGFFGSNSMSLTSISTEVGSAGAVSKLPPIASFTGLILADVFNPGAVASFSNSSSACHRLVVHGPMVVGEAVVLTLSFFSSPSPLFCDSSLFATALLDGG